MLVVGLTSLDDWAEVRASGRSDLGNLVDDWCRVVKLSIVLCFELLLVDGVVVLRVLVATLDAVISELGGSNSGNSCNCERSHQSVFSLKFLLN